MQRKPLPTPTVINQVEGMVEAGQNVYQVSTKDLLRGTRFE